MTGTAERAMLGPAVWSAKQSGVLWSLLRGVWLEGTVAVFCYRYSFEPASVFPFHLRRLSWWKHNLRWMCVCECVRVWGGCLCWHYAVDGSHGRQLLAPSFVPCILLTEHPQAVVLMRLADYRRPSLPPPLPPSCPLGSPAELQWLIQARLDRAGP